MSLRAASAPLRPVVLFGLLSVLLLLGVWGVSTLLFANSVLPVTGFVVISLAAGMGLVRHYAHPSLGACNVVTLLRSALVSVLMGAIVVPPSTDTAAWILCGLAVLALSMDGLDGWLARRTGLSSGFGARFDMETDALLGAVLSIILWQTGTPLIVLLLGFMRYIFVVATWIWPWLSAPLPDNMRRKTVCVIQIAALIILLVPVLPAALFTLILWGATLTLGWSFALDIAQLERARR